MSARRSTAADVTSVLRGTSTGEGKWQARCPSHDDKNPSLSIDTGQNGQILLHCFAGCSYEAIIDALERDFGLVLRKPKGAGRPRQSTRIAKKPALPHEEATAPIPTAEADLSQPPAEASPQELPKSGNGAVRADIPIALNTDLCVPTRGGRWT